MAHLGKDGYSHIHYDSAQARTISVREAARLQSFPDGFQMDQDGDQIIGEPVDDQYSGSFVIALCGTDPLKGETIPEYQLTAASAVRNALSRSERRQYHHLMSAMYR